MSSFTSAFVCLMLFSNAIAEGRSPQLAKIPTADADIGHDLKRHRTNAGRWKIQSGGAGEVINCSQKPARVFQTITADEPTRKAS